MQLKVAGTGRVEACVYCGGIREVCTARGYAGSGGRVGSKAVVKVGSRALRISH